MISEPILTPIAIVSLVAIVPLLVPALLVGIRGVVRNERWPFPLATGLSVLAAIALGVLGRDFDRAWYVLPLMCGPAIAANLGAALAPTRRLRRLAPIATAASIVLALLSVAWAA